MPTEAVPPPEADGAGRCPVCGEALPGRPERCFRCQADLLDWWRLEAALARESVATGTPSRPGGPVLARRAPWVVAALASLAAGLGLGFLIPRGPSRPLASTPAPAAAPAPTARQTEAEPPPRSPGPAPAISYVVQKGDSLWRIAASVKGDARRWREVEAENPDAGPLRPGMALRITVERSEQ